MSEEKILQAIEALTASMEKGFTEMGARFEAIENRLGQQERKARRTAHRQTLQENEIQQLKEIVQRLAASEPYWAQGNRVAISKEAAYKEFGECGIGKVTALRALQKTGVIKQDSQGKNTCTIYLDGECKRVIMVCTDK